MECHCLTYFSVVRYIDLGFGDSQRIDSEHAGRKIADRNIVGVVGFRRTSGIHCLIVGAGMLVRLGMVCFVGYCPFEDKRYSFSQTDFVEGYDDWGICHCQGMYYSSFVGDNPCFDGKARFCYYCRVVETVVFRDTFFEFDLGI